MKQSTLVCQTPPCPRNHKYPFVTETRPSVIKISFKEASKSSSNSNSSLCPKRPFKGKRSARQSKPSTEYSIMTNDNDVSDEAVKSVHPKQKSTKSAASGNGNVPLVKKLRKSEVMNKKECNSLKLQFLLTHHFTELYG